MRIGVVGCGHVGAVVAACFAEAGQEVLASDVNKARIAALRDAKVPFYEPGLRELVERNVQSGRLGFTTDTARVAGHAEVTFLCVGTPPDGDGNADLKPLFNAAESLARGIEKPAVVAIKSSVPVGTTERVRDAVSKIAQAPVDFAFVPEFLKEGDAVRDLMKPDRVVVGAERPQVVDLMRSLHEPFLRTMKPFIAMDIRSAELTKYAANFMLAARISSINEIAKLCERLGADVEAVRRGTGADSRIGQPFLFPGIGFGGSCFPKDLAALVRMAEAEGINCRIARAVQETNRDQRQDFARRILERLEGLEGAVAAVWGLAFKPHTSDMREAPAVEVIQALLDAGVRVQAFDPRANETARGLFGDSISLAKDEYEAAEGADVLALLTEWEEFRQPEFGRLRKSMRRPVLFDGRNVWDPKVVRDLGFEYFCVGRP